MRTQMLCLPQYPLTLSTQFLLAALLCTSTASMNAATHQSAGNAQTESDSTANSGFSVAILPKFDVVSIKPPGPNTTWLIGVSPDGYHALNQPLGRTILRAFCHRLHRSKHCFKTLQTGYGTTNTILLPRYLRKTFPNRQWNASL